MIHYADSYQDRMQQAVKLALSLGASAAKISFTHGESTGVSFENGRLKETSNAEGLNYSIMVIVNGRRGVASGNQSEHFEELVQRAIDIARIGAQSHYDTFPQPAPAYQPIASYDPNVLHYAQDQMIQDCQELVDFLKDLEPTLVTNAGAGKSVSESVVVNSAGLVDNYMSTSWNIGAGFEKTTGTDMLFSGDGRSWGQLNHLYDLDAIKQSCADDLRHAAREATLPDGKYPLIVPPSFVMRFLAPLFMGINGRNVFRGTSPLHDKLHATPFSSALSIEDNPFIDFAAGSANMDSVGLPTQRRLLIENGRINLFLYDYDTAFMAQQSPTANSGCSPYNPLIIPGTTSKDALFKNVRRGLLIKHLLGFGQSNFANGDFAANVELGFVIENGDISGRIKNAMISGNIFEMLAQPLTISSDIDPANLQPYVLFPEVTVVSK